MTDEELLRASGLGLPGGLCRENLREHLLRLRKVWMDNALRGLDENMRREPPPDNPDWFTGWPNLIGLALIEAGFASVARDLFREARLHAMQYRADTGNHRHVGALVAHEAQAYGHLGDYDLAAVCLLLGYSEDQTTHNAKSHDASFGIKVIWEQMVRSPVLNRCLEILQTEEPETSREQLESGFKALGDAEFALLMYCKTLIEHVNIEAEFANVFSKLRIVSSLRDISAILEIRLKDKAKRKSLIAACESLFKDGASRDSFRSDGEAIGILTPRERTKREPRVAATVQIQRGLDLHAHKREERFKRSLLVSYATRNYAVHEMDIVGPLVVPDTTKKIFGHLLNVLVHA